MDEALELISKLENKLLGLSRIHMRVLKEHKCELADLLTRMMQFLSPESAFLLES